MSSSLAPLAAFGSLIAAFALAGCAPGPIAAPYGSQLVMPEDISFAVDSSWTTPGDQVGGLFYTYIGVLGPDGEPLNDIQIEVTSGWTGAYLIAEQAVRVVDGYETNCATNPPTDPTDPCYAWFDVEGQQYIEFSGDYAELGGFQPTYMSAATDNRGILPVYVFVDSVGVDSSDSPVNIPIFASIGTETLSFQLAPTF